VLAGDLGGGRRGESGRGRPGSNGRFVGDGRIAADMLLPLGLPFTDALLTEDAKGPELFDGFDGL